MVIATDTNERWGGLLRLTPPGWQEATHEGYAEIAASRAASDLVITPGVRGNPFRYDKAAEFYALGEAAARGEMAGIRAVLGRTA